MREISFRGKRIDNDEWVYGDLIHYGENDLRILQQNNRKWDILEAGDQVIPETIGQYTGLTDTDGNKIFEEDIVCSYGRTVHQIVFDESYGAWNMHNPECPDFMLAKSDLYRNEIIGNIHDNPELLEVEK